MTTRHDTSRTGRTSRLSLSTGSTPVTKQPAMGEPGGPDDALLSMGEVALIVRTPVATLRYWRHLGTGPHSFRVGRAVRYWRSEVQAWLREQSAIPGPEQGSRSGFRPGPGAA